jgi:integrase
MTPKQVPTVREYVGKVSAAAAPSTRSLLRPYWDHLINGWPPKKGKGPVECAFGDYKLDEVDALDLVAGRNLAMERSRRRANSQGGQSAGEHYVTAARMLFSAAFAAGLITKDPSDPASLKKPRRPPSPREAIPREIVQKLWLAAASGGMDPHLDVLLLRFHLETGARRAGALGLAMKDVNVNRQTVTILEKGMVKREQPVTKALLTALRNHGVQRGAQLNSTDLVLRYRNGTPMTARRYDLLFKRLRKEVPEAGPISLHYLRHTAITLVERVSSYSVARRFAGHSASASAETTSTYITVPMSDVALAVGRVWGEAHPLSQGRE